MPSNSTCAWLTNYLNHVQMTLNLLLKEIPLTTFYHPSREQEIYHWLNSFLNHRCGILGIDKEFMECNIFACLETHLAKGFSQKSDLNTLLKL